jgi:hypothetical protein
MGANTAANIGTRKLIRTLTPPEYRNFENDGVTQYSVLRVSLDFMGTTYNQGDALPFDVGGTSYSAAALQLLQLFWDQEWIVPTV